MKTTLADYLLSTLALSILLAASVWPVWIFSSWSSHWFGAYHVLVDVALALLFYGVLSALAIRVLLRLRPMPSGTYSMDSPTFTWWKLITVIYHFGQSALKPLTPIFLTPLVAMLYGARVGSDVALGGIIDAPFVVSIGDRVTVGAFALVSGNFTTRETLILGPVKIGSGATIGVNAVVFPNTEIGENAVLLGGSYLMPGSKIPAGETWRGNPARKWM